MNYLTTMRLVIYKSMKPFSKQWLVVRTTHKNTPLICACIALNEFLSRASKDETLEVIPVGFRNFMKILFDNFESDINKRIPKEKSIVKSMIDESKKCSTTPFAMLINDRCCDLIDDLARISQKVPSRKIDFEFVDSDDCTIIHKTIILKQIKLVLKLIELNSCNLEQKCLNKVKYLNENLLQMCIRNRLFDLYDLILDKLYTNNSDKDFLVLIQQTNMNKQNLLHVLASLSLDERAKFSVQRLQRLFQHIKTRLQHDNSTYETVAAAFLNAKDKNDRTALHLCMIGRDCTQCSDTNIDMETFLIEQKADLLVRDCFQRIPLHYLFCNTFTNKTIETKKAIKTKKLFIPQDLAGITIDPVELLTMLTSSMNYKNIDEPDMFGYTPLHYAAIRGSTISCSHLIEKHCKILAKYQTNLNTPLSSSIYYNHKSCVLTLLKSLPVDELNANDMTNGGGGSGTAHAKSIMKDYYFISENDDSNKLEDETTTAVSAAADVDELVRIKWSPKLSDRTKPPNKYALYEIMLKNNWEGVSWLILSQLEEYGLRRLDVIVYAINACNYNLALRLIEKYERLDETFSFHRELLTQTVEHGRTLLHVICMQTIDSSNLEEAKTNAFSKIIEKLLAVNNIDPQKNLLRKKFYELKQLVNDFLYLKDDFNCTAIHYACVQHNYLLVDYLLNNFEASSILLSKDGKQQTAFSFTLLVNWQNEIHRKKFEKDK